MTWCAARAGNFLPFVYGFERVCCDKDGRVERLVNLAIESECTKIIDFLLRTYELQSKVKIYTDNVEIVRYLRKYHGDKVVIET